MPRTKRDISVALLAAARDGDLTITEAAQAAAVSGRLFGIRLREFMYGQAKQRSPKALKECVRWLGFCRKIGFKTEEVDALDRLWWRYHDEDGNLLVPPRAVALGRPFGFGHKRSPSTR